MRDEELIAEKIDEVEDEMRRAGLWESGHPEWVTVFHHTAVPAEKGFCQWLQFIYLPNLSQDLQHHRTPAREQNLAPQAVKFFGEGMRRGRMLQLLVELDSLL